MKMRYMITFGDQFWKSMDKINNAMNDEYDPIRIEITNPVTHASRYIYAFGDMTGDGTITKFTHMVSILESTLFPFQYSYPGPNVKISVLLENDDGDKTYVDIYEYPAEPVLTWWDHAMYPFKKAINLLRSIITGVGAGINNFFGKL